MIDTKALSNLQNHQTAMCNKATLLYQCNLPEHTQNGTFFAPTLYEIDDISVLTREVFGPVVHVIRYPAKGLEQVLSDINSTGFGLTMGIHSRIEERTQRLAQLSRAGNVYINRNMIGAIVGAQPFGGRGLSGTGPKAGGPHYLSRLMKERATPTPTQLPHYAQPDQALSSNQTATDEAQQFMQHAKQVENTWWHTSVNDRSSCVRQLLSKIASVDIVEELADDLDRTLATSRTQLGHIERILAKPKTLPGPTGESNTLHLEPRGILVCFADKDVTFEYWTLSVVTALATGNTVISVVSDRFYEEALAFTEKFNQSGAPQGVFQVAKLHHLSALLLHKHLAGVVVDSSTDRTAHITQLLAEREGAILPVITAEYSDKLILRLTTEKTISIDTTASGGNASLMTLEEDDGDA